MPLIPILIAYLIGKFYDFFIAKAINLIIRKHTKSDDMVDLIGDMAQKVAERSDNELDDEWVENLRLTLEDKKVKIDSPNEDKKEG